MLSIVNASWDARAHTHTHAPQKTLRMPVSILCQSWVMGYLFFLFYGSKGIGYWFHVMTSEMPTF